MGEHVNSTVPLVKIQFLAIDEVSIFIYYSYFDPVCHITVGINTKGNFGGFEIFPPAREMGSFSIGISSICILGTVTGRWRFRTILLWFFTIPAASRKS
jgi:hypothetical protein